MPDGPRTQVAPLDVDEAARQQLFAMIEAMVTVAGLTVAGAAAIV